MENVIDSATFIFIVMSHQQRRFVMHSAAHRDICASTRSDFGSDQADQALALELLLVHGQCKLFYVRPKTDQIL